MNKKQIGKYIETKRTEKNYTRDKLAESVGVSQMTVLDWESGRVLPDYSIIQTLCGVLGITPVELLNAQDFDPSINQDYSDEEILELLHHAQEEQDKKFTVTGSFLIILGNLFMIVQTRFGGTHLLDFISGILTGLAIVLMLIGLFLIARSTSKNH